MVLGKQLLVVMVFTARKYRLNRNGNLAIFSHMFVIAKKFKELFALILNGITVSVRCVSFMTAVLNA